MPDTNLNNELSKLTIDKSPRQPSFGGIGRYSLLLILASVMGGGGFFAYTKIWAATPVEVTQPKREIAAARTGTAVLTAGGYIIARDVYDISTRIVGRVKEILVERGDIVKTGDTIITIEDREYRAQVRLAAARVASAQARLDQMRAGSRPEEIARARAEAASAEATAIKAKADEVRIARLTREGVSSTQELDLAKANRGVAEANLRAMEELARLAELGPRSEEIQIAAAQLQEAEASLEFSQTQLSFTIITAPITGTILEKVAKKGEMVTSSNFGGTRGARSSVVSMADLTDLQVELDINEDDLPRVRMGQECEIRVDSYPKEIIRGVVDEIAPRADRQKATVQAKVKIFDPPSFLRPEVNARVTFLHDEPAEGNSAETTASLWIPNAAVVRGADGAEVYVAFQGRATQRRVTTGREGPLGIEITDGLVGDELVITSPLDQITDGAAVTPSPAR